MKRVRVLIVLCCATLTAGVWAQQGGPSAGGGAPAELDQWIRATSGASKAVSDPNSETRFLASLTRAERQGAFLFRQRCYACHYSALSPMSWPAPRSGTSRAVRRWRTTIADYGANAGLPLWLTVADRFNHPVPEEAEGP
jgi:hypothetical protein